MKLTKGLLAVAIAATIGFVGCKPKDADIKAEVEKAIKANPDMSGLTADVQDGVVTLSGNCKDEACKTSAAATAQGVKGVKSVVNDITLPPPPPPPTPAATEPASVSTVLDAATQQKVKDGLKDIPGVSVTFEADKAVLTGEVSKANRMKIMQMLAAAKVKSDVTKLMDKK
jgi:hyperosmotically inducible periplasmic protein